MNLFLNGFFIQVYLLTVFQYLRINEAFPRLPEMVYLQELIEYQFVNVFASIGNYTIKKTHFALKNQLQVFHVTDMTAPQHKFHIGSFFAEGTYQVIIPPSASYDSYEKMLLPFDKTTWFFLTMVFGAAFAIIFVINLMPRWVQDIVYGHMVKLPAFNVLGTFFGIGQTRLPENHFARIILMFFIIFCLIIRCAYQGMFESFQNHH